MLEAVGAVFPEAKYQRCTVHFYRNVFFVMPRSKIKLVAKMLKAIHAQESKNAAREKARAVVEELRSMKLKGAARNVKKLTKNFRKLFKGTLIPDELDAYKVSRIDLCVNIHCDTEKIFRELVRVLRKLPTPHKYQRVYKKHGGKKEIYFLI